MDAIRNLPYPRSGSNLVAGLELLVTQVFREENGDRHSVPNVAVVIGASNADRRENEVESVNIAVRDAGIRLLVIAVTQNESPPTNELSTIRSIGTQIYLVDRFQDLPSVMDEVMEQSCLEEGIHVATVEKIATYLYLEKMQNWDL